MKISRLDLDGVGSPAALAARIFEIEPDLPIPLPIEALCERFDIIAIEELETDGFEAALITDELKSSGSILVAENRSPQRRRFSIGHELGHFLIPTHLPQEGASFFCSADDMRRLDPKDQVRRRRMEFEANRFSASLLIPPHFLRSELRKIRQIEVTDIVRLARDFDVSKDAMARACVEQSRHAIAVVVIRNGSVLRHYRSPNSFPWIDTGPGQRVPPGSIYHEGYGVHAASQVTECEPEIWLSDHEARKVDILTEQVLGQKNGFSLLLLLAELADDDDDETGEFRPNW